MIRVALTLSLGIDGIVCWSSQKRAWTSETSRQSQPSAMVTLLLVAALFVLSKPVSAGTPLEIAYPALRKTTCSILVTDVSQPSFPTSIIGTGFFISAQGLIATNRHVVDDRSLTYSIDCLGKISGTTVIYRSATHDIAILKSSFSNTPFNAFSEKHPLHHVGKEVFYMGSPRGLAGSFTNGTIGNTIQTPAGIVFQLSGLVNPGNSGGAVLDGEGHVVGIVTARLEDSPGMAAITPAYAALADREIRKVLGEEPSELWEFMGDAIESQLLDPRTKRLVAFVDQCYEQSGMVTVDGEGRGSMNEEDACARLRSISALRPRIGLYNMNQEFGMMSSANILIKGDHNSLYTFLIKRFIGPERYEIISVEPGKTVARDFLDGIEKQFSVADLFWLNAE